MARQYAMIRVEMEDGYDLGEEVGQQGLVDGVKTMEAVRSAEITVWGEIEDGPIAANGDVQESDPS